MDHTLKNPLLFKFGVVVEQKLKVKTCLICKLRLLPDPDFVPASEKPYLKSTKSTKFLNESKHKIKSLNLAPHDISSTCISIYTNCKILAFVVSLDHC